MEYIQIKKCSKCLLEKTLIEFWKNKQTRDGLHYRCKVCARLRERLRYYKYKDKDLARESSYREKRKYKIKKTHSEYYKKNREKLLKQSKEWKKRNPEKVRQRHLRRSLFEKLSIPKWVKRSKINKIYNEAIEMTEKTGIKHVVDHIYPLDHKILCGLTVPWNLRVITNEENIKKGKLLPKEFYFGTK